MPTLDAFMGDIFYPLAVLQFLFQVPRALGYKYLFTVFLAGLFMYLFLRRALGIERGISLLGAICYMFNTEFISHMFPGHDGKMFVISLLPFSLFGLKRLLDTRNIKYLVALSASIGLCLLTSHVQATYFSLWGIFFFFLFEVIRAYVKTRDKRSGFIKSAFFVVAVILGLGIGMVQFLPPFKFTKQYSVRSEGEKTSYEHAISWSIHPEETASLIVPEFCGFSDKNQRERRYWGRNPFKLNNEYAGIVVLMLSVFLIILLRKDPFLLFWAGMALFALIFALGGNTPFFYLFYYLIPGVKLFRAPSMIMFWFSFSLVTLSAYGLHQFFIRQADLSTEKRERYAKRVLTALYILAGLTVLVSIGQGLVLGIWKGILFSGMTDQQVQVFKANYKNFIKGAWFALGFGGAALLGIYLLLKERIQRIPLLVLLMVVALADLFRVDAYFYKLVRPSDYINQNDPVLHGLAARQVEERFRVFPVQGLGQTDAQLHGLESITGFHDNEIKWYREFRGGPQNANFVYLLKRRVVEGNPFLDLLNTKYIIYRPDRNRPLVPLENRGHLKRAFCVSDYEVAEANQIIPKLKSPGFPYRTKILIETEPPGFISKDTGTVPCGEVLKIEYKGERRSYDVAMDRNGFLVLSEIYLPYWHAYENETELKVLKTNLALMSVPLKAGRHRIVMKYESPFIKLGALLTFLSIGICIFLLVINHVFLKANRCDQAAMQETGEDKA
jgi:hypothetical protein